MASETHETVWQAEWRARLVLDDAKRSGEINDAARHAAGALLDAAPFDIADVRIEQTETQLVVTLTHDKAKAKAYRDAAEERDRADAARNTRTADRS